MPGCDETFQRSTIAQENSIKGRSFPTQVQILHQQASISSTSLSLSKVYPKQNQLSISTRRNPLQKQSRCNSPNFSLSSPSLPAVHWLPRTSLSHRHHHHPQPPFRRTLAATVLHRTAATRIALTELMEFTPAAMPTVRSFAPSLLHLVESRMC